MPRNYDVNVSNSLLLTFSHFTKEMWNDKFGRADFCYTNLRVQLSSYDIQVNYPQIEF